MARHAHQSAMPFPQQLARRDLARLHGYAELLAFYQGDQWPRSMLASRRQRLNYARALVEKTTSYLMSGMRSVVDPGAARPQALADAQGTRVRDLRVDGGLVQPAAPPHVDRRSQSRRLRTAVHDSGECGMIIKKQAVRETGVGSILILTAMNAAAWLVVLLIHTPAF